MEVITLGVGTPGSVGGLIRFGLSGGIPVALPNSDVSVGGWQPSTGTTLFSVVADADDTTYMFSTSGESTDAAEVGFGNVEEPTGDLSVEITSRLGS
jgi:hypothetical protein